MTPGFHRDHSVLGCADGGGAGLRRVRMDKIQLALVGAYDTLPE